jgi:hypothetical protein
MSRSPFTLLELVVCIIILGCLAGVLGWQAKDMVDLYQFRGYGKKLKEEFEKLQILALTYQSDMELELKKEKGVWKLSSKTEERALKKNFNRSHTLSLVEEVVWNKKKTLREVFVIFSTGQIDRKGVLEFRRKGESFYIDLSMPLPIQLSFQPPPAVRWTVPQRPES